jgi:hypothetical protein
MEGVSVYRERKGGNHTRFEDFPFPELAVWRMDRLLGTVIPAYSYPELTHPSTTHGVRKQVKKGTQGRLTVPLTDST